MNQLCILFPHAMNYFLNIQISPTLTSLYQSFHLIYLSIVPSSGKMIRIEEELEKGGRDLCHSLFFG